MKYDYYNRPDPEVIYLAKPGKRLYCALSGVDTSTVLMSENGDDTSKLSFDIYSHVDGEASNGYEYITRQMELCVNGIWFKIEEEPIVDHDGKKEVKHVEAESLEIELSHYDLNGFKINQGTEDSWEVINHNNDDDPYQIKFYNEENPLFSLLHLILKYADVPNWEIGYVDFITANPDYPEMILPNEIYGFDIDSKDVYSFLTQDVAQAYSCIFRFDTVNMLINAYRVEGIGKDTNVFVGFRNIQNSVSVSSNRDLYTVFNVVGNDDLNIDYVNFGSSDIEDITHFLTEQFLPSETIEKYKEWLEYRETQRQPYIDASKEYNQLVKDIEEITYRVPTDAVNNDWSEMSTEDLQMAYDDYIVIVGAFEENYVDDQGNFDLDALKLSPDWDLYESIMNYILPTIISILQNREVTIENYGTGNLLNNVNPVITDGWLKTNSESNIESVILKDVPCYGLTHGIKSSLTTTGNYGIFQSGISATPAIDHTVSAYVKANTVSALKIGFRYSGDTDWIYSGAVFNLPENAWIRVFYTYTFLHSDIDICYQITSSNANSECIIAGMQLEIGSAATSFGFSILGDDVINAWETDWKLYGTQELSIKLLSYQDQRDLLVSQGFNEPWIEMSDFEQDYHNQMYQKYLDYCSLCEQCQDAYNDRLTELDALTEKQSDAQSTRLEIANNVAKENYGFSEDEIAHIKKLYKKNTYKNENIVTTDFDTTSNVVDKQYQLYTKALDQLYMESHSQYHYEDSADNIFALSEFKEFHDQVALFNYIRVGIRDDYCIKLRLLGIEYNPCTWDGASFMIRFSDMLQYKNKRNDFVTMLDNAISSAKSSVSSGNSSNKVTSYTFSVDMIKALFSNSSFKTSLGSTINAQTGKFDSAYIKNLSAYSVISKLAMADTGVFEKLIADSSFMKYLAANLIVATKISVKDLLAQTATSELITLISSSTGDPTIAFKDSTQQFYDSDGNVRVQIGQDLEGSFNFIVRGTDGTTALFDENGITKDAIADDLIVNDMIKTGTVSKDKLNFPIVETDENGKVSITEFLDGDGNEFGTRYTEFETLTNNTINSLTDTIHGVSTTLDANTKAIKDKVWQTDIYTVKDKDGIEIEKTLRDILVQSTTDINGIYSTVSSMETSFSGDILSLTNQMTAVSQTADKISWLFTNDSTSTSLTLQDGVISAITNQFIVTGANGEDVIIQDGKITASDIVGTNGQINLSKGTFDYGNGKLVWDGNTLAVSGVINAIEGGTIGGFNIGSTYIANGTSILGTDDNSVYVGTDGISCGTSFTVTKDGSLLLGSGTLSYDKTNGLKIVGDVKANSITALTSYKIYTTDYERSFVEFKTSTSNYSIPIQDLNIGFTNSSYINFRYEPLNNGGSNLNSMTLHATGGIYLQDYIIANDSMFISKNLEVGKNLEVVSNLTTDGNMYLAGGGGSNYFYLRNYANDAWVSGITVTSSNNLRIGSNSTSYNSLQLYAGNNGNDSSISLYHGGTNSFRVGQDDTGIFIRSLPTYERTYTGGANMSVTSAGTFGRNTSSSRRYKYDITNLDLSEVKGLYDMPTCTFKYKDGYISQDDERYDKDIPGFIVEELEKILPVAVDHLKDGRPEMWNSNILVPAMLALIQNNHAEIEILNTKVEELQKALQQFG